MEPLKLIRRNFQNVYLNILLRRNRILLTLICFASTAFIEVTGATYYTVASGAINGDIWSSTINGTPGPLPNLANGDIIYIDDNISITTNFQAWQNINLTIYLNSAITISGQWWLQQNTQIMFQSSSAKVIAAGGGNSDKIKFGNSNTWSGNDGDLTGPGTLDKNYNPATSPLPIKLIFCKVNRIGTSLVLQWATATELNFDHFSVERSADGKTFSEISRIKGHGTTNTRNDYELYDTQPLIGKNYYRLKSKDFDGYTEYFDVVVADYSGEKLFVVSPNPSDGSILNFALNFSPDENSIIVIYDNLGTTIQFARPVDVQQVITFANRLKSGLYYAKISTKDLTMVEKFIVR